MITPAGRFAVPLTVTESPPVGTGGETAASGVIAAGQMESSALLDAAVVYVAIAPVTA
jgi:hypothetical protein